MAFPHVQLPDTPPDLLHFADGLDCGDEIWIGRLTGRHYKEIGLIGAREEGDLTRESIVSAITANVRTEGNCRFAVTLPTFASSKQWDVAIRWFAFLPEDSEHEEHGVTHSERLLLRMLNRGRDDLAAERQQNRDLAQLYGANFPAMIGVVNKGFKQAAKLSRKANKALRRAAEGQQDSAVRIAEIQAKEARWAAGFGAIQMYLKGHGEEEKTVQKIQAAVRKILGEHQSMVKATEPGKAFFAAKNADALRNAGLEIQKMIAGRKIELPANVVAALMQLVKQITG